MVSTSTAEVRPDTTLTWHRDLLRGLVPIAARARTARPLGTPEQPCNG